MIASIHFPFSRDFDGQFHIEDQRKRYWEMRAILYKPAEIQQIRERWKTH